MISIDQVVEQGTISNIEYDYVTLYQLRPTVRGKVFLYGKLQDTPRYMQGYGHDYTFSGVKHGALPIPEVLQPFLDWANTLYNHHFLFNTLFVNWYVNGHDYINAHADKEDEHVKQSPIISISLGATRTFRIRDIKTKTIIKDITMTDQSYIVMKHPMQKHYTHEVPKINGKKGAQVGSRINITIRAFK